MDLTRRRAPCHSPVAQWNGRRGSVGASSGPALPRAAVRTRIRTVCCRWVGGWATVRLPASAIRDKTANALESVGSSLLACAARGQAEPLAVLLTRPRQRHSSKTTSIVPQSAADLGCATVGALTVARGGVRIGENARRDRSSTAECATPRAPCGARDVRACPKSEGEALCHELLFRPRTFQMGNQSAVRRARARSGPSEPARPPSAQWEQEDQPRQRRDSA